MNSLEIVVERPPVWEMVRAKFKIQDDKTVFTYGDKLYNPADVPIDEFLYAHEQTHQKQHAAYEGGPAAWWARYLEDREFRVEQEMEAYRVQYKAFAKQCKDRERCFRFRMQLANDLASPMYGAGIFPVYAAALILQKQSPTE